MGETPNLDLPYPELADTADVPRDIRALADKLDVLLGGGGGGGGGGTIPLAAAPVLAVGMPNQVRAGRALTPADFTSMGLSTPVGLFGLGDLTNQGSAGPLVNLGAVPFGAGINGLASTCAVFAGSTGQALYIADTGAADPFRIKTGSWGCWFRTAKRGVRQVLMARNNSAGAGATQGLWLEAHSSNVAQMTTGAAGLANASGVSDVADDRWHFAVSTYDGTTGRLYVDGVLEAATSADPGPLPAAAVPLNISGFGADGGTAGTLPFYGRVDEAFVTPDVLTDDQIRLLYTTRLAHTLGAIPGSTRMAVHRRRKGAAWAVPDFTTQPVRLHNFTAGALTDQGSGGVALTANPGTGTITDVAGADGTPAAAKSFSGAHAGLSATDAGLPGGLTARSYGAWFKTTTIAAAAVMGWGTISTADARAYLGAGVLYSQSGADAITGPYLADGQWHLMVITEDNVAGDGVRRKMYIDGRLVGGSTVLNSITLAGANRLRVGAATDGTQPMAGQLDGAFITNYAMAVNEIQGLYAKGTQDLGASPKEPGQHVERVDATSVLFTADTLETQHTVDLGVAA